MGWVRPVTAGLLSAVVGYASTFTLVLPERTENDEYEIFHGPVSLSQFIPRR